MLPSSRPSCSLGYLGRQDSTNRSLSTVIFLSAQVSLVSNLESTVFLSGLSCTWSPPLRFLRFRPRSRPRPRLHPLSRLRFHPRPRLLLPSVRQDYPPRNNAVVQTPGLTNRALGCPQAPSSILRDDDVCGMKVPAVKTSLCMYVCVFLPLRDRDSTIFNILGSQPGT